MKWCLGADGKDLPLAHDDYCWMNAAYAQVGLMARAFDETGFCTAIRGEENGGVVENLPQHMFTSESGEEVMKCPTEFAISDRRELELSNLGFLALVHMKETTKAVFYGGQTTQKAKPYDTDEATSNALISTRLPYVMAASRFAHCLKIMARGKVGSFLEAEDCERWLNRWIKQYVNAMPGAGAADRAKYPLKAGRVEVQEDPKNPGAYNAIAYCSPGLAWRN